MSVSFENKETNRGVLTFTISQDQIKPELDRVFNSVKKSLNVPGFRKGHLPRPISSTKIWWRVTLPRRYERSFCQMLMKQL